MTSQMVASARADEMCCFVLFEICDFLYISFTLTNLIKKIIVGVLSSLNVLQNLLIVVACHF